MADNNSNQKPAAFSIPFKELPSSAYIRGYAPEKPKRPTIQLKTKDGQTITRYLDNMTESPDPTPEEKHKLGFTVHVPTESEERQHLLELTEKCRATDIIDKYRSEHRVEWDEEGIGGGYTTLPILQHMWGKRLDNTLVAWLKAFNPTCVRVTHGICTTDAITGRVTVLLKEEKPGRDHDVIERIEQEVAVGFSSGYNLGVVHDYLHENGPNPAPAPRFVGHVGGLSRDDFK